VGGTGPQNIGRHKRTRAYSPDDYLTVVKICDKFGKVFVCPHVLAEASNLVRYSAEPLRGMAAAKLKDISRVIEERQVESKTAMDHDAYPRLGLTDAVILTLIENDATLLSDDLDLCLAADAGRQRVINYNHVRDGGYSLADIGKS
jgi:hypothetical protein